ncbi:hypothetical protein DFP73DRAFT_158550 [Morchella snyderi]|nr:hypothetical protein DFP73DRAFT_158550 [Morchella snyderi]
MPLTLHSSVLRYCRLALGKLNSVTHLTLLLFVFLGGFRFLSLHTHFYIFALALFSFLSYFFYTGNMKRDTLIQAISQFALFSVALAAHDHKRGGRETWGEGGKKLAPYHFQDIPRCMVDCIYRMDRSDLPHCTPDKYYDRFDVRDFVRDPEVADCFCNDVFFLKGFSECVIDSCKRPSQFYRAGQWGWDHCKARGVNLLSPQNIPYIPRGADLFKNWDPERYASPRFIPEPIEDRTSTATVTSTANFTMTSTHVSTATATSVSVSVSTHFTNTQTLLSTVGGPVTLTTTLFGPFVCKEVL